MLTAILLGVVTAPPIPLPWPAAWDGVWSLERESWEASGNITDQQNVSYDWGARRMTVLHTDMYSAGPGRDWNLPDGSIVFKSSNESIACCTMFPASQHGGQVPPNWMQGDNATYVGTESVFDYADAKLVMAHKWAQPGFLHTDFYWQGLDGLPLQFGDPTAPGGGLFILRRKMVTRPQSQTLLRPPAECTTTAAQRRCGKLANLP